MMQDSEYHLQARHKNYLCRTQQYICRQLTQAYQHREAGRLFAALMCYQQAYDRSLTLARLAPEYSLLQATSCALLLGQCYHQQALTCQAVRMYRQFAQHLQQQRNNQARRRRLLRRCQSSVAQALHELMA